jgi:serine/threonine-protein kinase
MPFVELPAGSTFAGRYRVLRRLAMGGMGAVYEVVHLETDRRRALKVMLPDLLGSGRLSERFRHEARVTANVQSEFLVDVFDAGVDAATGMPFLVMELLIGEELGRRVQRVGPLTAAEVVVHLTQVASALDKTHARSIVHRDLKPANLFLAPREDGSSRVKILDFGIAKIVSEASSTGITQRNAGTPAYMSPEQLLGEPVSPASDIHALGLIAFTLLVGRSYWQDDVESVDNVFAFALRAQDGPKEPAGARAARHGCTLPAAFDAWFERTTHREPAARFASASEAANALVVALAVDPHAAASVSATAPVDTSSSFSATSPLERAPSRSRRYLWLGLAALVVAALGGLAALRGRAASSRDEMPVARPSARPSLGSAAQAQTAAAAAVTVRGPAAEQPAVPTSVAAPAVSNAPTAPLAAETARTNRSRRGAASRTAPSAHAGAPRNPTTVASEKARRHTRD